MSSGEVGSSMKLEKAVYINMLAYCNIGGMELTVAYI